MTLVPIVTVCEVAIIVLCDVPLVCRGVECVEPLVPNNKNRIVPQVTD